MTTAVPSRVFPDLVVTTSRTNLIRDSKTCATKHATARVQPGPTHCAQQHHSCQKAAAIRNSMGKHILCSLLQQAALS